MNIDLSDTSWIYDFKQFIAAILMAYVRINCIMSLVPLLKTGIAPRITRTSLLLSLSLFTYPLYTNLYIDSYIVAIQVLLKEIIIGLLLGFILGIPFYILESIGFIVDNQRGGSSAAMNSFISGDESSPIGEALLIISILLFCNSYGLEGLLELLYRSYVIWPIDSFLPYYSMRDMLQFTQAALSVMMHAIAVIASPFIFSMILIELSLGLISKFAPQLNVFFLAMSIKSVVAFIALFISMPFLPDAFFNVLNNSRELVVMLFNAHTEILPLDH